MKKILLLALLGFVSLSVYPSGGAAAGDGEGAMDARDFAYSMLFDSNEARPQFTKTEDIPGYSAMLSKLSPFDLHGRFRLMNLGFACLPDQQSEAVQLIMQILNDTGLNNVESIFYDESNNLKTEDVNLLQDCYDDMINMIRLAHEQDEFGESSDEFESQQSESVRFYMNTIEFIERSLPALAQKIKADLEKLRSSQSTGLYKAQRVVGAAASKVSNAASAAASTASSLASAAASTVSNAASAAWSYVPSFGGWGRRSPAAGDTASVVGSPAAGGDDAASTVDSPAAGS